MFEAASIDVLKYGALGLGLAIVVYAAVLLKQEMSRPRTKRGARSLIVMFMIFGLLVFGGGGYLEIAKQKTATDVEMLKARLTTETERATQAAARIRALETERDAMKAMLGTIVGRIGAIDGYLGGKYEAEAKRLRETGQQDSLLFFTNSICREIASVKKLVQPDVPAECKIVP